MSQPYLLLCTHQLTLCYVNIILALDSSVGHRLLSSWSLLIWIHIITARKANPLLILMSNLLEKDEEKRKKKKKKKMRSSKNGFPQIYLCSASWKLSGSFSEALTFVIDSWRLANGDLIEFILPSLSWKSIGSFNLQFLAISLFLPPVFPNLPSLT